MIFIMGMIAIVCVLPIQKFIQAHIDSHQWQLVLWAGAEEIIKYLAVLIVLYRTKYIDEPIEWPIYMITVALGFAALENTLFLIAPLANGEIAKSLLTGNLRFIGATLLHIAASSIIGAFAAFLFYKSKKIKDAAIFIGLIVAVILHATFNLIINTEKDNALMIAFAVAWATIIVVLAVFEKVKRLPR